MQLYIVSFKFGFQVFLGEVNAGLSTTQVVVKELKASASIQEQTQFLEEALPYRSKLVCSLVLTFILTPFPRLFISSIHSFSISGP